MKILVLLLFLSVSVSVFAQPVILTDANTHYSIGKQVEFLIDSDQHLTLAQVQRQAFVRSTQEILTFGAQDAVQWFRFRIHNNTGQDLNWLFEHAFVHADQIDFYELNEQGQLIQKVITGDARGHSGRPLATVHYTIPLKLKPHQTHTFYVRFGGLTLAVYPLHIWEQKAFYEKEQFNNLFLGLYFGIILTFMIYYLLLFVYNPNRGYFYFSAFMLCSLALETFRGNGELIMRYVLSAGGAAPLVGAKASKMCHFLVILCSIFGLLLYNQISQLSKVSLLLHRLTWWILLFNVFVFGLVCIEVIPIQYSLSLQFLPAVSLYGLFIPINIMRVRQGHTPSIYLLCSSVVFFMGLLVFAGHILGFSTNTDFGATHALNIVWLTETIFMSLGFAAGVRNERQAYINKLKAGNEELTLKNQEISEAVLKGQKLERQRVERELHDTLGSVLWSVRASLFGVQATQLTEKQQEGYKKVEELLLRAEKEVRHIAHAQFPTELEKQGGLQPTLQRYIDDLNGLRSTHFKLEASLPTETMLDTKTKFELYTIVRELTTNILKHAQATDALITLQQENKMLILSVQDNGRGFDVMKSSKGAGMKNLSHRVQTELKGELIVESDTNGTKITIRWSQSVSAEVLSE